MNQNDITEAYFQEILKDVEVLENTTTIKEFLKKASTPAVRVFRVCGSKGGITIPIDYLKTYRIGEDNTLHLTFTQNIFKDGTNHCSVEFDTEDAVIACVTDMIEWYGK